MNKPGLNRIASALLAGTTRGAAPSALRPPGGRSRRYLPPHLVLATLFGCGHGERRESTGEEERPDLSMIQLKPIGVVHSPFKQAKGTPVQPRVATSAQGTVEVFGQYREGLKDLAAFDRIWLVCWFHRASAPRMQIVPYLDDTERGLFATRAPSRPNPIGISPVRLIRVDGNILTVSELDVLDGTPLLDIKPYSPHFDCFEESKSGWLDQSDHHRRFADERFEAGAPGSEQPGNPQSGE